MLFFVRHGETDWRQMEARGVRGWATSFAPLTPLGRLQIDTIANDYRLQDAEGILCSSYARALESAARLSRVLNKPLYVEYDLHEWLPQKDSLANIDQQLLDVANEQLRREMNQAPELVDMPWESLEQVRRRVIAVLKRYQHLEKVIVVSHAVVISSLVGLERLVEHAEIVEFDLPLDGEPEPVRKRRRLEAW
jgi:broad specificity phosphatase PhoE